MPQQLAGIAVATPSSILETDARALKETPRFALDTSSKGRVMVFGATTFNTTMSFFGGVDNESFARRGTVQTWPFDVWVDSYRSIPGSTNTINLYMVVGRYGDPHADNDRNARAYHLHLQEKTSDSWRIYARVTQPVYYSGAGPVFWGSNPVAFDDVPPHPGAVTKGFAVYPGLVARTPPGFVFDPPIAYRDKVGACIYLYAAGTKGLISKHRISLSDPDKLRPARVDEITAVNLPDNGLRNYQCDKDHVILFWIGLTDATQIPNTDTFPHPPDFNPLDYNLTRLRDNEDPGNTIQGYSF